MGSTQNPLYFDIRKPADWAECRLWKRARAIGISEAGVQQHKLSYYLRYETKHYIFSFFSIWCLEQINSDGLSAKVRAVYRIYRATDSCAKCCRFNPLEASLHMAIFLHRPLFQVYWLPDIKIDFGIFVRIAAETSHTVLL